MRSLEGIVADVEILKDTVESTLEAIVAYGDLLENSDLAAEEERPRGVLLYAAPPSFVARESGAVLLIGITPDQRSPLPDELEARIEFVNHVRRLPSEAGDELQQELIQLGIIELPRDVWLKAPSAEEAAQHLARIGNLLESKSPSGGVPGLILLDPASSVRYYRGCWVEPQHQTGRFIGRRRQAYGAALWCYVQLRDGNPERFVDFPLTGSRSRGCDEAWRLQMAIDAHRGEPQRFRLRNGPRGTQILELFSPVPMWIQRRWDAIGEPVGTSGCLFAYRFHENEVSEELRYAREMLWLEELDTNEGR